MTEEPFIPDLAPVVSFLLSKRHVWLDSVYLLGNFFRENLQGTGRYNLSPSETLGIDLHSGMVLKNKG